MAARPWGTSDVDGYLRRHGLRDAAVIGFGLTLAGLVVGGVLGTANVRQLTRNERQVARTHEVIGELESLPSTLKDAETGQRGYLLTGDEKYLQPYEEALRRVQATAAHLGVLTSDNLEQQARLALLGPKIAAKLDELGQTIALVKEGDRPAAMKIVRGDSGRAMMDDLRERVALMRQAEEKLLRRRAEESEASSRTTTLSVLLPAVIGVVLLGAVFSLNQRNLATRQRAAEVLAEQRERLRTTLASIGDAVISTDAGGRVTLMNAVAEALTGWELGEAAGRPLDAVFRIVNEQTRRPADDPAAGIMEKGTVVGLANHTVLIARDGSERPIDDSAAPIRDGQGRVVGCVLVFRDVTERRRVERERAEAEEALREADRRKDEFLATLAHELRNPLAPLRNALELLRRAEDRADLRETARAMMERQLGVMSGWSTTCSTSRASAGGSCSSARSGSSWRRWSAVPWRRPARPSRPRPTS
jgi:PAS domain S-box-containing protein